MKSDEDAHALRCFEQALLVARQGGKKFDEADALDMLGKVCSVDPFTKIITLKCYWR